MAGALVGGAFLSAFLQVAFDRVASREVLDYLKGRKLIDGLLQKLKIELMSADAVLIDAEEKQITNPAVKKWLDELKDAVYVADDLLDEIAYEALRCKLEAESTSKVMGFISTFVNSFDRRIQSELEKVLNTLESITKRKDVLCLKEVVGRVPSRPLTTSCPEEYVTLQSNGYQIPYVLCTICKPCYCQNVSPSSSCLPRCGDWSTYAT
ncbi:putative disease resistance rpp13-like protein 1 [Fagus crenata]